METRVCKRCQDTKQIEEFRKWKGVCRPCEAADRREWAKDNPNYYKERYLRNKDLALQQSKERHLKATYGISENDYQTFKQVCAICGITQEAHVAKISSRLCVDHCHTTGRVRGLLCKECNIGLGKFKDDSMLLYKAVDYLVIESYCAVSYLNPKGITVARRIIAGTAPAPVAPTVPLAPAPPYPAAVAMTQAPPVSAPPGNYAPAPMAPPQVPGYPPVQAPAPMEQQLAAAVYQNAAQAPVAPPPQAAPQAVYQAPAPVVPSGSPLHMDMGAEAPKVFKTVPAGVVAEAEITKAELKTNNNNNQQISLQLRTTWPKEHSGAVFFDNVVLVATTAWKYKSLCAACVDENENRLLSEDNRYFTGQSVEDFIGNVVRFTADEPRLSQAGNPVNVVKGGYNEAFDTFKAEGAVESPAPAQAFTPGIVPPVPQF